MASRQIIDFIEQKFAEYGVKKLIPDDKTFDQHARRVIKDRLTQKILDTFEDDIQRDTDAAELPADFRQQIERVLEGTSRAALGRCRLGHPQPAERSGGRRMTAAVRYRKREVLDFIERHIRRSTSERAQ